MKDITYMQSETIHLNTLCATQKISLFTVLIDIWCLTEPCPAISHQLKLFLASV